MTGLSQTDDDILIRRFKALEGSRRFWKALEDSKGTYNLWRYVYGFEANFEDLMSLPYVK